MGGVSEPKKSAATRLVELAKDRYGVRLAEDGTVFAVPLDQTPLIYELRGGRHSLRSMMARDFYAKEGSAPPQQALADALVVLEGEAADRNPEPLHLRVARVGDAVWLDLGDASGRAVKITLTGWSVADIGVPMFRRTALTAPLPQPDRSGDLALLWELLNISEEDRPLLLAWLVSTLMPKMPHPIVGLFGEQGTGKSTAAAVLSKVIDASPVPIRKAPRDADSWITAASGSWVVALDNVSMVPDWLSDTLCRAVTGDGDVRRKLYTDGGLAVFAFRRYLIVTGIDLGAVRGDLADRLLTIDLDRIADTDRLEEEAIWPRWQTLHPLILGGLLNFTVQVMAALPSTVLASKPRMADYARVLATVDRLIGTNGLERYLHRGQVLATESLSADPFILRLKGVIPIEGATSADLLRMATPTSDATWQAPKGWPQSARAVTTALRRQGPVMRRAGWTVEEIPPGHDNAIRWSITPPAGTYSSRKEASHGSHDSRPASDAREASQGCATTTYVGGPRPCAKCGEPMDLLEPGQITHPDCAREEP